jgi:hypothetical protein
MSKWLVIAVLPALAVSSAATAQMSARLVPGQATTRALDLRLSQELGVQRPMPLVRGLLVRRDIARNATVGLGLANIYGKRKGAAEWRVGEPTPHSRKPAVTFILRF